MFPALSLIFLLLLCSPAQANLRNGLVGWFALDDGTGTTAIDSGGLSNSGTLTNTPLWITNCSRNNCLNFTAGSSQFVNVPNKASYQTTSFSVSLWFQVPVTFNSSSTVSMPLFSKYSSDNDSGAGTGNAVLTLRGTDYSGGSGAAGDIQAKYETTGASNYFHTTTTSWTAGTWYNVVGVYAAATANDIIYVNGVNVTGTNSGGTETTNNITAYIGIGEGKYDTLNLVGTKYFTGNIDDFRIYNRALTAQEALDIYNQGIKINNAKINF